MFSIHGGEAFMASKVGLVVAGVVIGVAAVGGGGYYYANQKIEQDVRTALAEVQKTLPAGSALTYGAIVSSPFGGQAAVKDVVLTTPQASTKMQTLTLSQIDETHGSFTAEQVSVVEVLAPGATDTAATMTINSLSVENLDIATVERLVNADQTALADLSVGSISMDVAMVTSAEGASKIGSLRIGPVEKGRFESIAVENISGQDKDNAQFSLGKLNISGLDVSGGATAPTAMDAIERLLIDGASAENLYALGEKDKEISIKRIVIDDVGRWEGISTTGHVLIEEMRVPFKGGGRQAARMAKDFGVEALVLDLESRSAFDPKANSVTASLNLNAHDMAKLDVDLGIAGFAIDPKTFAAMTVEQRQEVSIDAFLASTLSRMDIKIADLGLIKKSVAKQASNMDTTTGELVEQIQQIVAQQATQIFEAELAQSMADEVGAFLTDKDNLSVSIRPIGTVPFAAMAGMDPSEILDIQVVAD